MKITIPPYTLHLMEEFNESFLTQWKEFTSPCQHPFLQEDYLMACIRNADENHTCYPIMVFENNRPVFVFILQKIVIPLQNLSDSLLSGSVGGISKLPCNRIEWLTIGHHLISGEYGYYGNSDTLKALFDYPLFYMLLKKFCSRFQISFLLLKDVPALYPSGSSCFYKKIIPIRTEPDMIIQFPASLKSLENYLSLFSKKYRQRYRKVLEKGSVLKFIPVQSTNDLVLSEYYNLFLQVHEKAAYRFVRPSPQYFKDLTGKKSLYIEKILIKSREVGFLSYFIQGNTMWAHYIGLDYSINREYEIYQNILLHFVKKAIEHKAHALHLGRTAAEIKSCLGADPVYYHNYLIPGNLFSNWFIRQISGLFSEKEWIKRNPLSGNKP